MSDLTTMDYIMELSMRRVQAEHERDEARAALAEAEARIEAVRETAGADCENFTDADNGRHNRPAPVGYCLTRGGRTTTATEGASLACWPCRLLAALTGEADT